MNEYDFEINSYRQDKPGDKSLKQTIIAEHEHTARRKLLRMAHQNGWFIRSITLVAVNPVKK